MDVSLECLQALTIHYRSLWICCNVVMCFLPVRLVLLTSCLLKEISYFISAGVFPGSYAWWKLWTQQIVASYAKLPGWSYMDLPSVPHPVHSLCASEGPLIRVICVSHHLVALRTHWRLVDCSIQLASCFCFWTYLAFLKLRSLPRGRGQDVVSDLIISEQHQVQQCREEFWSAMIKENVPCTSGKDKLSLKCVALIFFFNLTHIHMFNAIEGSGGTCGFNMMWALILLSFMFDHMCKKLERCCQITQCMSVF